MMDFPTFATLPDDPDSYRDRDYCLKRP